VPATETTFKLRGELETPVVTFDISAYIDIITIVDNHDEEISWLASVIRDGYTFHVKTVYLLQQRCSAATTVFDAEAQLTLQNELIEAMGDDAGLEEFGRLALWGHSHVRMGASPSGQDEKQMNDMMDNAPWFIRMITNKNGEVRLTVCLQEEGYEFDKCPWSLEIPGIDYEERVEFWKGEIEHKVSKEFPSVVVGGTAYQRVEAMYLDNSYDWRNRQIGAPAGEAIGNYRQGGGVDVSSLHDLSAEVRKEKKERLAAKQNMGVTTNGTGVGPRGGKA